MVVNHLTMLYESKEDDRLFSVSFNDLFYSCARVVGARVIALIDSFKDPSKML